MKEKSHQANYFILTTILIVFETFYHHDTPHHARLLDCDVLKCRFNVFNTRLSLENYKKKLEKEREKLFQIAVLLIKLVKLLIILRISLFSSLTGNIKN